MFGLLRLRRFGPFFWTQFFGAFNDNLYKTALAILIGFSAGSAAERSTLVNVSQGLLILPFFLFSATAGQLADKYEKSRLVRIVKLVEIVIMTIAAAGFFMRSVPVLLAALFLMGTQSTMFGPVKYSILPQHLEEEELVGGNGLIEMGTFVAILFGSIVGGLIMRFKLLGPGIVSGVVLCVALLGYLTSRRVPSAAAADPGLTVSYNAPRETWRTIGFAREERAVFLSILGISWLWAYGAIFLAQLLGFTTDILGGNEDVVTVLLASFSLGIGTGSLLCERMSGGKIEIGLVPFGAFGMTVFAADLYFASPAPLEAGSTVALTLITTTMGARIVADMLLIGMFGGFFSVPLYALVQHRSRAEVRSRIIAANNIINAGFMVAATAAAIVLLRFANLSIPELFLATAVCNAAVAIYIFTIVPEFLMRFLIWMLMHTMYRLRVEGIEQVPDDGAAVVVCNHVSYVDALVISAACRRPIRFVTWYKIYNMPVLNFIFRTGKAIPIAGRSEDPAVMDKAFADVKQALADGDLVCIFPEGGLTKDGEMMRFRPGVERILRDSPVQVVPMALQGLWGSFFSRKGGTAMRRWRGMFSRIALVCGPAVVPERASAAELEELVAELRDGRA